MFSFSKRPEKIVLPQILHRNMIFLVLSGKIIYFLPKIWSYSLGGKWKIIFLEKNTWKYDIFFRCSEKMVFLKKLHCNMIFLVLSGKMAFFPWKHDIFPVDEKWKMVFLNKYMEIWYFLYIRIDITNMILRPSVKKNQRWSSPAKIHLKVINIPHWCSRKSSNNSLYFYGDLYRRFHILLSSKKNQET